jgi:wobble nucleotide-excising tRNase
MIEEIHLANEGSYDAEGTSFYGLKALNFVFGPNGSGKTTVSRVIDGEEAYPDCTVTWVADNSLETQVYNRDFVQKHFDAESSIKGIYTFGENVEVAEKIKSLKAEADEISGKLAGLKGTLSGGDGNSGKQKERDDLQGQLIEDVWVAKKNLDDLSGAFSGLNNNKNNFCTRYLAEVENNKATLRDIGELRDDAATVFSNSLTEAAILPGPDSSVLAALENDAILIKKIIGKEDVDIAALIEKLGNSDWVQQGREYFDELNDRCPFCQQKTDAAFRQSLEDYFDESYVADLSDIGRLLDDYEANAKVLLDGYGISAIVESQFLDRDAFDKDLSTLRLALESNIDHIRDKKKEPSTPVALKDTKPLFAAVDAHIDAANKKVKANNDTLHNLDTRKKELSGQIWRRLLEDTKATCEKFKKASAGLDAAITSLSGQIEQRTAELEEKIGEIEENERQITSIKPTIDAINKLLKSFGFVNFYLVESAENGFYEVKRPSGEDAKDTLSEGEKSFITVLYFYHLIRGSFSASGATTDRIVVFDDPVSSLDADILFIVCNLIKGVVNEMREGNSAIKQIFVLTHNIYFHKEITFNRKRSGADALHDETFWIIRKSADRSELVSSAENPIRSSYELLWREIRQKSPSDTAIQNTMRRILENYFKFFGGVTPDDIIEKFDGQEKLICGSLFSWINDGSHFANDDLYMSCGPGQVDRYLAVFQRIFEVSGHGGHYKMMMGNDYAALPAVNDPDDQPAAATAAAAESTSSEFEFGRAPSHSPHADANQ